MTRNSVAVGAVFACAFAIGCGSQAGTPSAAAGSGATTGEQATKPGVTEPSTPATIAMNTKGGDTTLPAGGAASPAMMAGTGTAGTAEQSSAAGSGGDAAKDTDAGEAGSDAPADPSGSGAFPPVTDFAANGPFEAVTVASMGPNSNYTIYHPKDLAPNGAKNPIVGWMSGGGTDPSLYPLLPLLATHGFVVVASNTIPGIGEEANLGKEIIAGIEWAIAENERDGSTFFQKLDTEKLASAGYSMGSLATFQIAGDMRLTTTVHISGGNMAPEPIHNLHAPAAFLCGIPTPDCSDILSSACDIAAANCDIDFMSATTPVFYANFSSGHLGILTPPFQEQIQAEVVAWLRWQLMGDATVKARFVGEQCGVCTDDRWKVQQKNLD